MGVFNGAFNKNQTGQLLNKAARQGQQLLPLLRHPLGPLLKIENPKIHRGFLSSFFIIFPKKKMTITWRIPQKPIELITSFPFKKIATLGPSLLSRHAQRTKKLQPASACAVRGAQTGDPTAGINLRRMFRYTGNLEFSAFHTSTV